MSEHLNPDNLEQLIEQISETTHESEQVSPDSILNVVGRRSFGPLLLVAGLITVFPVIGDIPGVPTIMGVFVLLIAGEVVVERSTLAPALAARSICEPR